jgi:hypothetical protein
LDWSPRILLAMYSCEIQASSEKPLFKDIAAKYTDRATQQRRS